MADRIGSLGAKENPRASQRLRGVAAEIEDIIHASNGSAWTAANRILDHLEQRDLLKLHAGNGTNPRF